MSRKPNQRAAATRLQGSASECTTRCCLPAHAYKINMLVASGASIEEIKRKALAICSNPYRNSTGSGQTPLHVAAAYGRCDVIEFLKGHLTVAELNTPEKESGYTALHVAIHTGNVQCALLLLQLGADLFVKDSEGYSPLMLARLDRAEQNPPTFEEFFTSPQDCHPTVHALSWGTNDNLLLGHADDKARALPEFMINLSCSRPAEREDRAGMKPVRPKAALSKFHMVLLTSHGEVYTCGHGRGGRLGHGNEESQLTPRLVDGLRKSTVHLVAAGQNHSVFVDTENCLYTCGSNESGQLGPSHSSKQANAHSVRPRRVLLKDNQAIVGVAASRYHTAIITSSKLYVFGTDRGQLGRTESHNPRVSAPFCVPLAYQNGTEFVLHEVAASNDVTACLCSANTWHEDHMATSYFVFVCMDYSIHLASSSSVGLSQLNLWTRPSTQVSYSKGAKKAEVKAAAKETVVVCLSEQRDLWSWCRGDSSFRKCFFANGPPAGEIKELVVTCKLAVVTSLGEIYAGSPVRQKNASLSSARKAGPVEESLRSLAMEVKKQQEMISNSHFKPLVVSRVPMVDQAWLLAMDPKGDNFVALLALPKMKLPCLPTQAHLELSSNSLYAALEQGPTHDVEFQTENKCSVYSHRYFLASHDTAFLSRLKTSTDGHFIVKATRKFSSDTVMSLLSALGRGWMSGKENEPLSVDDQPRTGESSGFVQVSEAVFRCYHALFGASMPPSGRQTWSRLKCPDMHDITIETLDGVHLGAHKCVLVLRSPEYFSNMFLHGWRESASNGLPTPLRINSQVAEVLLDYLYEDDLKVSDSWDVDLLCHVWAEADSMLLPRLKSLCEYHLVSRLDHRNVADLLDFSIFYGSKPLFKICCDFIYFYCPLMLESRLLDGVPMEDIENVFTDYCSKLPISRSMPVIGPETVVDVLQSQSSRSDRSPGDSGFSLDEPDFGEEDAHQYIVKGKGGCRRRQLSQNKTDQRCSSVDLDPGDFMPEVEWDDLGDDDGDDSDIGEDVDDSNGASWISGEGSVCPKETSVSEAIPVIASPQCQSTPKLGRRGRKKFKSFATTPEADSTCSPGSWTSQEPDNTNPSTSSLSFSDIMQQQKVQQRTPSPGQHVPNHQSYVQAKKAPSTKPIDINPSIQWNAQPKQSQSQRKKKGKAIVETAPSPPCQSGSSPGDGSRNAWSKPSGQGSLPAQSPTPSFLDIQNQEKAAACTPLSASGSRCSRISSSAGKVRPRKLSWTELESAQLGTPSNTSSQPIAKVNAWGLSSTPVQPVDVSKSPASLHSIMQSEHDALLPQPVSASKQMAIIQLEDKAIDELTAYYKKKFQEDRSVKVTRVSSTKPSAAPQWQRMCA